MPSGSACSPRKSSRETRSSCPANTFIATFAAVRQAGGIPVPVDASEEDYNLDPALVESGRHRAHTLRRARPPVRAAGEHASASGRSPATTGSSVVEDACQAHGAQRDGLRAGAAAAAAAFSFYPSKNLGAAGDAGALVTDDDAARRARPRAPAPRRGARSTGSAFEGYTARLDTIQAIVLLHKLPHLDEWTEQRRAPPRFYSDALEGVGDLRLPPVPAGSDPVWHLYVVRTATRRPWRATLPSARDRHGPPLSRAASSLRAFAWLGYERGRFPVTERIAREVLSLPLFPGITEAAARRRRERDRRATLADGPGNEAPYRLIADVEFGEGVVVQAFTNLYGCRIGDETRIGPFVEIQAGRSSAPAARSRATRSSATASRSETGSSSGTA